ncbi:hypothetical protein CSKR_114437 [Clonorchis sinensis]|uniref:Uncharacterized protein n=1 Tax=Clonorchis sinensis TaxID=79923 RepID=A0A3R7GXV4_CLOSI|nr:hypothetical protein CSKR_114437 [Clonorchis sinensis]
MRRIQRGLQNPGVKISSDNNHYALSTHKVQGTGRRRAVAEHETYNPGALGVVELVERSLLRYELICCMTETWAFRAAELRRFRVLDNPCLKTIARVGHGNTCVADALVFVALLMEHDGCLYDFEWVVSVKLNRSEQDYVTNIQGLFGYHLLSVHPKFGGFFSIEFCRDDLSWSEIQGRSGNIQAGLNLEFSHLDPSSVDILPEGTNGFLANLDLVNAVVRLANKHSIEPIVNNQVVLLYGRETWPVRAPELRCLRGFGSRCRRTMARVSWYRRICNVAIRERIFGYATGTSNCPEPEVA